MSQQPARNSFASEDSGYSAIYSETSDIQQESACPECKTSHRDRSRPVDDQDRTVRSKINDKLTPRDIHNISSEVGSVWKDLGRELGFPETSIDDFAERENNKERAIGMLTTFTQREGKEATRGRLVKALKDEKVGRRDIAEKLQQLWGEENVETPQTITLQEIATGFTDKNEKFTVCRDNESKRPFLLYPIDECQVERLSSAYKILLTDAKKVLQSCDAGKDSETDNNDQSNQQIHSTLEENFAKLQELKDELEKVIDFQNRQDHHEDYVIVPEDVKGCAKLAQKLQNNCSKLLHLTPAACLVNDPMDMKSEIYNHSVNLSLAQKDLEERILWLKDKASRNPELVDEAKELEKVLNQCQCLRIEIKKHESLCHTLLQHEFIEPKRTQSEPVRRRPPVTETTWRPNSSIEPISSPIDQLDSSREATAAQTQQVQQARPEENNEGEA